MSSPEERFTVETVVEISHECDSVGGSINQVGESWVEILLSVVLPGNGVDFVDPVSDIHDSSLRVLTK